MSFKFKWSQRTQDEVENSLWFVSRGISEFAPWQKQYKKFLERKMDGSATEIELNHMERSLVLNALMQVYELHVFENKENPELYGIFKEDEENYPELKQVGECNSYELIYLICSKNW